jgi:hypothetical protein
MFDSVSIDAVCNLMAKQALEVALKTGLDAARGRILEVCVDMIRASRGGGGFGGAYSGGPQQQQQQQGVNMPEAIQVTIATVLVQPHAGPVGNVCKVC